MTTRRTEAWWVCTVCEKPLVRVGKRGLHKLFVEHRKVCGPQAGGMMRQIEQGKRKP